MMTGCKFWVSTERRCAQPAAWVVGQAIDLCEDHGRVFLKGIEDASDRVGPADSIVRVLRFRPLRAST